MFPESCSRAAGWAATRPESDRVGPRALRARPSPQPRPRPQPSTRPRPAGFVRNSGASFGGIREDGAQPAFTLSPHPLPGTVQGDAVGVGLLFPSSPDCWTRRNIRERPAARLAPEFSCRWSQAQGPGQQARGKEQLRPRSSDGSRALHPNPGSPGRGFLPPHPSPPPAAWAGRCGADVPSAALLCNVEV